MVKRIFRIGNNLSTDFMFMAVVLIAGLTLSCTAQEGDWQYAEFTYTVNNEDPIQFGYMVWPDYPGPGIGPKSIILYSRYALVTDEVHGNVKRIDLISGELKASPALRDRPRVAWPNDIAVLDSLVYVASDRDCIYVLDADMAHLYTLPLPSGDEPYFIQISDDSLVIYQTIGNHLTVVYSPDSVIALNDTSMWFRYYETPHGKRYVLDADSTTLETDRFVLPLRSRFPDVLSELDAINIDFNDSTLVYYEVNETEFVLHVYRKGW